MKLFVFKKYYLSILIPIVGIFLWEHVGRQKDYTQRPSIYLTWIAEKAQNLFEHIGRYFAWISSFLTKIDLGDILKTIHDLLKPIFDLIVSPFYFMIGYLDMASEYLSKSWLIYIGSAILFVLVWYGLYFGYKYYKKRRIVQQ